MSVILLLSELLLAITLDVVIVGSSHNTMILLDIVVVEVLMSLIIVSLPFPLSLESSVIFIVVKLVIVLFIVILSVVMKFGGHVTSPEHDTV